MLSAGTVGEVSRNDIYFTDVKNYTLELSEENLGLGLGLLG